MDADRGKADATAEAVAVTGQERTGGAQSALARIRALVDEQAEDEALWALNLDGTLPISEAYLQQELRRLHALVEGVTGG